MQAGMESCLTKSIMAGGMGFALGGAFGLFMSSVRLRLFFFFLSRSFVKHGWATISTALLERPFLFPLSRFMGRGSTNVVWPLTQMSYDTPLTPQGQALSNLPVREQLRRGFKDMGSRSYSSAKNFALIGAIYSGTECCIEGFRAKSDLKNSVIAGCITGGALAYKAGPQAAALGCAGFASFSAAIDYYMRMPGE